VKARAATIIYKYDQVDVDILLEEWCEKKNQVGHSFACSCVVLLILIIYLFIIYIKGFARGSPYSVFLAFS
jgi:hypothetical protein